MRAFALACAAALTPALLAAALAQDGAQPPAGEGTEDRRRRLAARVARLRGRAEVLPTGDTAWKALAERALLGSGDRVRAEGGAVELVLPEDEAAVRDQSHDGGDRVVLAPDASVTIAPPSGADVRLDAGEVWAVGQGGLDVEAGGDRVRIDDGEAGIELGRGGGVEVTVHSGEARVQSGGAERTATSGERVTVDARGVRVTRATPRRPTWVAALDQVEPQALLGCEEFRVWPGGWHDHWGERTREGAILSSTSFVTATEPPIPGDRRAEVRFGRSTEAGGIVELRANARVRVRYRLSVDAPLELRLNLGGASQSRVTSGLAPGLAGGWREVEFRPEAMQPEGTATAGVLVTYLSVVAGVVDAGEQPRLELSRVLVYVGK